MHELAASGNDSVIVRSTIDLGHAMGLKVVAEGVEDESTLRALRTLGCDLAQGYLLSRPLPSQEFCDWLNSRVPLASPTPLRTAQRGSADAEARHRGPARVSGIGPS